MDKMRAKGQATYGSWNTAEEELNFQSGQIAPLNNAKFLFNFDNLASDGALSYQHLNRDNFLLKVEDEITPNWVLTIFGNYEVLTENLSDNNGATPAQVFKYG